MSVWRLTKKFKFEASHQLMHHDGKCARLHGHSWNGEVIVEGYSLNTDGPKENMVLDYSDMKAILKPLIETYLDHWHLNDTLKTDMPTSEYVAKWLYEDLKIKLPMLLAVVIEETCTSRCEYRENE